jgi:glucosamine kinase
MAWRRQTNRRPKQGAAGVVTAPETRDFLRARLVPLTTSGRIVVVDDVSLVLPAAGLTDGIAVISGTGSIAVGAWQGRTALVGGWGYLLGDEGSGYWIVRSAIRELPGSAAKRHRPARRVPARRIASQVLSAETLGS